MVEIKAAARLKEEQPAVLTAAPDALDAALKELVAATKKVLKFKAIKTLTESGFAMLVAEAADSKVDKALSILDALELTDVQKAAVSKAPLSVWGIQGKKNDIFYNLTFDMTTRVLMLYVSGKS